MPKERAGIRRYVRPYRPARRPRYYPNAGEAPVPLRTDTHSGIRGMDGRYRVFGGPFREERDRQINDPRQRLKLPYPEVNVLTNDPDSDSDSDLPQPDFEQWAPRRNNFTIGGTAQPSIPVPRRPFDPNPKNLHAPTWIDFLSASERRNKELQLFSTQRFSRYGTEQQRAGAGVDIRPWFRTIERRSQAVAGQGLQFDSLRIGPD